MFAPFPLGLDSPGAFLRCLPHQRSPARLTAIIGEHFFRGYLRYSRRDVDGDGYDETFCNVVTQDVAEAMHATLPRHMRANDIAKWLRELGPAHGWSVVSERVAQMAADRGSFCLASTVNPKGPGHLAMLVPSLGEPGTWVAQAGRTNFTRGPLRAAFGGLEPDFFVHT